MDAEQSLSTCRRAVADDGEVLALGGTVVDVVAVVGVIVTSAIVVGGIAAVKGCHCRRRCGRCGCAVVGGRRGGRRCRGGGSCQNAGIAVALHSVIERRKSCRIQ